MSARGTERADAGWAVQGRTGHHGRGEPAGLEAAEHIFVPLDGQVGVHAALEEDLRAADGVELGDLFV